MAVVLKKHKQIKATTTTKHCDKTNRIHTRARTSLVWLVAKYCHPLLDIYITITNELFRNNKRACRPHRTTHHGSDSKVKSVYNTNVTLLLMVFCLCFTSSVFAHTLKPIDYSPPPPPPPRPLPKEREREKGRGGAHRHRRTHSRKHGQGHTGKRP